MIDDESCFVFKDGIVDEWNLRTGAVLRHGFGGASGVIAEFAAAAGQGLRSRIVWPESESEWDGATVRLRATASSPPINFVVTDPAATEDESTFSEGKRRTFYFLPGSREDEVLLLSRGRTDVWLSAVSLAEEAVFRWTATRSQIVDDPGEKIIHHHVPPGIARGHRYIPLIVETVDGYQRAVVRSSDGKLVRRQPIEPYTAATDVISSGDGRRMAWDWTV